MDRHLKILLVENHEDTAFYLSRHLRHAGHAVTLARSAAEALSSAQRIERDVLLCDIGLPDDDGWTLLENLADRRPRLCIAMTGYGMPADVAKSLRAGFDHHLTKPFLPSELERLLALA